MSDFAKKLIRIDERGGGSNVPSAIFGTIGSLPQSVVSQIPLRIGMWPCICEDEPQIAMGIWVTLAYLLERWQDIRVYRLFARLEGEPADFEWSIEQSQFGIDDWTIEDLDENIAIWGQLKTIDGNQWQLDVMIENDLASDEDEMQTLSLVATTLGGFFAKLPGFSVTIAQAIDAERLDETETVYKLTDEMPKSNAIVEFSELLLRWEVHLLAYLWGITWDDEEIVDAYETLVEEGLELGNDYAAWVIPKAVVQALRPGYTLIGELLIPRLDDLVKSFPESRHSTILMSEAVFKLGYAQNSYQLLEAETENHPQSVETWLKLAELLARGGRLSESVNRFQMAIEKEAVNRALYRAYGNVLLAADRYGEPIEAFILIDPDDYDYDEILWEAIEAYQAALDLEPDDVSVLYLQLLQLATVAEEEDELDRLWQGFGRLLNADDSGELLREVIDSLYDIEDVGPGVQLVEEKMKQEGERIDLYINLASLHLVQDFGEEALPYLQNALKIAETIEQKAEVERLLLSAEDDKFEQRFGELAAILDAGNAISSDDVDFLEKVTDKAPHLIEGYLVLAKAYHSWEDPDAALEVLLDAQRELPDNPNILEFLARILWQSGEKELAFQYLNRGIAKYPNHVPLLVRTGLFLFNNGQLQQARLFLAHAEEISPRNPALKSVKTYIANEMSKRRESYQDEQE